MKLEQNTKKWRHWNIMDIMDFWVMTQWERARRVNPNILQHPGQRLSAHRMVSLQTQPITVLSEANSCPGHCSRASIVGSTVAIQDTTLTIISVHRNGDLHQNWRGVVGVGVQDTPAGGRDGLAGGKFHRGRGKVDQTDISGCKQENSFNKHWANFHNQMHFFKCVKCLPHKLSPKSLLPLLPTWIRS